MSKPGLTDPAVIQKFKSIFREGEAGQCWIWPGWKFKSGYGGFSIDRQHKYRAHRVAFAYFIGPVPEGYEVCHTCDCPPCVNPAHLFVGDHHANMADAKKKGRMVPSKGELQGQSVLTRFQVICIRKFQSAGVAMSVLSEWFHAGKTTISHVVHRESWQHVK